ncbi:hypothetical protein [Leclercia adecarboxylata]|uniref:hypothetical protein n=1 Tax=Leclercia adecarboxylata TaxID=83655 RepID=UPI00111B9823|nr:hypothetical protein [Leclercia adecarboxylata]QCZ27812.1 hypothetical protein FHN83_14720 [Leclercia adecarboxylata]
MKFAIDKLFDIGLINGWVAADNGSADIVFKVIIKTPNEIIHQQSANNIRPDVKSVGLHKTGACGFSFNAKAYGVREGDFIFIELMREDGEERVTHSFLYAEKDETKLQFDRFEVPRDDFSIMEKSTELVLKDYPHLLALKILLIRLRRNKRAKGWRGQFSGINYSYKESDWELFYNIISTFRETIFNNLSARNLFSITDTIADFSTPLERCAALNLSMFMFHERFSQTLNPLSKDNNSIHLNPKIQHTIWDGMLANKLEADDALDVYLTRAYENLKSTPLILNFFQVLIKKAMNEKNSIFHGNLKNSEYFREAWSFYQTKFCDDLKRDCRSINQNSVSK